MRVVFMGTPPFATPTLCALHQAGHEIASVITQPDRPAGRGREMTPPPVKEKALKLGLAVFQPRRIKAPDALTYLESRAPSVIVVVGYGQIIPQTILDLPRLGCVNVHASLLPKYRGAAPVNWAIANGETRTGVTTMRIERRLDAGPILLQRETLIDPAETAPKLSERLGLMGAQLLIETLRGLEKGAIKPEKQNEAEASYAPLLKREDGRVDWNLTAEQVYNRIRAFDPWPGSYTVFRGRRLHIRWARPASVSAAEPGAIFLSKGQLYVGCGEGTALAIEEVQLEGKRRVSADDFVHGRHPAENEKLGEEQP